MLSWIIIMAYREINRWMFQHRIRSSTLTFRSHRHHHHHRHHYNREIKMLIVHLNDSPGVAVYQEFDGPGGTGNKVPPSGIVTYTSSDTTVATVDSATGALTYIAAGSTVISASDSGN